jgi:class 3 adenylate cyclase
VNLTALDRLGSIGASGADDELAELRRRVLNLATAGIAAVSPVWIAVYAVLGLWGAAAIPLLWFLVTAAMLAAQARHPRPVLFRNVELAMMLALPFLLQWTLGGFAAGSAVCLWALTAPLGAVFFIGARAAVPWFAAYLGLLVLSAVLEPVLPAPADIPEAIRIGFFVIDLGAVSLTVFVLVSYFVRAREAEHERSEALLLNILPAPVARRLKRTPGVIADAYPEASVLFADIVGFTELTERLEPERLIALLDRVFTAWDGLAAVHGLEKIKTVGDAYMAVAGVPHERADHARAAVAMALEMPAALAACSDAVTGPLELRVGIDSGPVVAGVIGRTKFIYDLWGDTVNTASRMESTGEPGRIQVTARTAERLGEMPGLHERGSIAVKGKGPMATFLLDAA